MPYQSLPSSHVKLRLFRQATWTPTSWNRRPRRYAASESPSSPPRAPCRPGRWTHRSAVFNGARWCPPSYKFIKPMNTIVISCDK